MGSQRRRPERLIIRYREIYKVHLLTGPDSPWAGFMINEEIITVYSVLCTLLVGGGGEKKPFSAVCVCVCHSRAVCDMRSIKFGQ